MFDKTVIRRDDFVEMPDSSQNLYFHLSMDADDDGFVDNWKSIIRMTGKKEDDMKLLLAKKFIIPFDTGVIVIRHWRINNYLRKDRYSETKYLKERNELEEDNGVYDFKNKSKSDLVYQVATSGVHSIEKNSIEENSIEKYSIEYIVGHLNDKTGSNFKSSSRKTRKLIKTRLEEGFKQQDFITVIDTMVTHWLNDEKMCVYLRPETLFSNKFEGYLNRKQKKMTTNDLKIELGGLLDE